MLKGWINLWCVLSLVLIIAIASGTENNARTYWNTQGNELIKQGNYTRAAYCYNKSIELGNQTHAPIFGEISVLCGEYRMYTHDNNSSSHVSSKICAEPISVRGQSDVNSGGLVLRFDISNPNDMDMRIGNIYVDVIKYNPIVSSDIIKLFGTKRIVGCFCNIEPAIGSYKCIQASIGNDEFIDLAPKELEHFATNVYTDTPGIYQMRVELDYAIGWENNRIIVGNVPGTVGFFDEAIR
jgi:hypothetical protein